MQTKFTLSFLLFFSVFFLHAQSEEYVQDLTNTYFQSDGEIPVVFTRKEATLRDNCENKPDSIINRLWEMEAWEIDARRIFQYDTEGRDAAQTYERRTFDTGELAFFEKSEFTYSTNQSTTTISYFDADTEEFVLGLRSINTLEEDIIVSSLQENYEDGEWVPYRRYTYTYNEVGTRTETYTENWSELAQDYIPARIGSFYYTVIGEFAYADSIFSQIYVPETMEWEYTGFRIDYVRDTENRVVQAKIGDYFTIPGELNIFIREEFFYDAVGNSYDVISYYDLANEQPEELPLWRKYRNYFEGDLNVADSTFNYDAESMSFVLDQVSYMDYDIANRLFLITIQVNSNDGSGMFINTRQTEYYYQLCISNTEEENRTSADCKFANPISSEQRGICDLETSENARLNLYDVLGRNVLQQPITDGQSFSFGQLPANGVYFMTIENEAGLMLQRKVIVANE